MAMVPLVDWQVCFAPREGCENDRQIAESASARHHIQYRRSFLAAHTSHEARHADIVEKRGRCRQTSRVAADAGNRARIAAYDVGIARDISGDRCDAS